MIDSPFFRYYGSKFRAAKTIYPSPQFSTIIEPFAGSAGYSSAYSSRRVILYDKDPKICGLWNYLIRATEREIMALPDIGADNSLDEYALPQECKWLIGFWINQGTVSPCKRPSRWAKQEGVNKFWGVHRKRQIAKNLQHIRHWVVNCASYDACPTMRQATYFIDPPYVEMGRHYVHSSSKLDFHRLGRWCKLMPGQVMVCENEGANWLPFTPVGAIKSTRGAKWSREVIWTNP